jgi:aminopeptidase N
MPIPLKLGLLGGNGDDLPLELADGTKLAEGLIEVTDREQTFTFRNVPAAPTPSLLRDFSAPVRLTISLDPSQIEFLMMHDADPFNRWQAAQTYATNLLTAAAREGGNLEPVTGKEAARLAQALGTTASETALSSAYRAEFLKLPSESDIARELARKVDPDAVRKAYATLRARIGRKIQSTLVELYDGAASSGPFSPDAESAGKRALRSATLDLLAGTGERSEIDRALRHYRQASNMTDSIAALSILSHLDARDEVLADFYARWQDEPLVLDKWFAVQARAVRPDSVETVQGLLSHPKFSLKNPNRVRALIGSFVNGNPTGFNRADGAGYEILANTALQIDRFNPHMAARLLGAFESWRTLEPRRQALAKNSLRQLASSQLSTDSYEIVTKTLGAD